MQRSRTLSSLFSLVIDRACACACACARIQQNGGAVLISSVALSSVTLAASNFSQCRAPLGLGGAVYVVSAFRTVLATSGLRCQGNAAQSGGALAVSNVTHTSTGDSFFANSAQVCCVVDFVRSVNYVCCLWLDIDCSPAARRTGCSATCSCTAACFTTIAQCRAARRR